MRALPVVGATFRWPAIGSVVGATFRWPAGTTIAVDHLVPSYPEHVRTFDYIGPHRYFLTFCTHDRRPYFLDASLVHLVLEQFRRASSEEGFILTTYCFMPDHVHLLVEGEREDADLKRLVKLAKQYAGFAFAQQRRTRLWQRYGFERTLRSGEATDDVVRYIIANPVRAGLVTSPRDYPHWGSCRWTREELLEFVQWAT